MTAYDVFLEAWEVDQLRTLGRHFRDTGDKQLQKAAYRSALLRLKALRVHLRFLGIVR